jgi:hypothetical protein
LIVLRQLPIILVAQIARPHDALPIDIRTVINPLVLEDVLWPVAYKDQKLPWHSRQLAVDFDAAFGVVVINAVPHIEAAGIGGEGG